MKSHNNLSDAELFQRISLFDSKALEVLYDRYSSILFSLIKKIVIDGKTAEDLLADVYGLIWRKSEHCDVSKTDIYTWLIMLARNIAVDHMRRKRAGTLGEAISEHYEEMYLIPYIGHISSKRDLETSILQKDMIEDALTKLTDAQQFVIHMAYYEGYTPEEISQKLNIPEATVKSKIQIAVANLRENLQSSSGKTGND